jgi:hypothetical protein
MRTIGPTPKIVTLITRTEKRLVMRNGFRPFQYVIRIARRNGIIGCSYESSVNRRREKEGQPTNQGGEILYFNALELWNGKGVYDTPYTARHIDTNQRYICFRPSQDGEGDQVIVDETWYNDDGEEVQLDAIAPYFHRDSKNKRQNVNCPVLWRTVAFEHVEAVVYGGKVYEF